MSIGAEVIKHSVSNITELITVEVELHRFILPENNTHRVFSRNYQSSRAIPILRQLEQIANDPAMPVYWGKDKAGMKAEEELSGRERELAEMIILGMRDSCLNGVKQLQKLGLHKQISNRYVEPWMFTKGVITATKEGWESFFKLRSHPDAQPEIKELSDKIQEAIDNSFPEVLVEGEWHLPYVNLEDYDTLEDAIKVSVSCCAQVSYRRLDTSLEKAKKIYDMLYLPEGGKFKEEPPHFSACEHVAMATTEYHLADDHGLLYSGNGSGGNFQTTNWFQYRKMLEFGDETNILKPYG